MTNQPGGLAKRKWKGKTKSKGRRKHGKRSWSRWTNVPMEIRARSSTIAARKRKERVEIDHPLRHARVESVWRPHDSSRRIFELAETRKGTDPSSLWSFPDPPKGHRHGRWSSRRRQTWSDVVSDLRGARVCSEGQWPRPGVGLAAARTGRPRRHTRRPLVTRQILSRHRMAQGGSCARDRKWTADGTHWKGEAQGQRRAAK